MDRRPVSGIVAKAIEWLRRGKGVRDVFGTPRRLGDNLQDVVRSTRETERRCTEMKIKVIKVERIEATRPHPDPELEGGA
ncbi:hypothetical protein [Micromonospora coxensis]|uniref:hypothetical protein n=1 Tax=Micromonospora coxensis TaxID=356852 RepID=UPI0012FD79FD|nr:hypothetical protein [Micromonospora coxensis]